jgi:hypothetical protein
MNINYRWEIHALDCITKLCELSKVVERIHYRYIGTNDNNTSFTVYGSIVVPEPNLNSFIEYDNLNLNIVSSWLEEIMDMENIKNQIQNGIYEKENPTNVTLPLPNKED